MQINPGSHNGIAYERARGKLCAAEMQANPQFDSPANAAAVHNGLKWLLRNGPLRYERNDDGDAIAGHVANRDTVDERERSIQQRTGYLEHTVRPRFTLAELRTRVGRFESGKNTDADIAEFFDFAGTGRPERSRASSPERPRDQALSLCFSNVREGVSALPSSETAGPSVRALEPEPIVTPLIADAWPVKSPSPEIELRPVRLPENSKPVLDFVDFKALEKDFVSDFGGSPRGSDQSYDDPQLISSVNHESPTAGASCNLPRLAELAIPPQQIVDNLLEMAPILSEHEDVHELFVNFSYAADALAPATRNDALKRLLRVIDEIPDPYTRARFLGQFAKRFDE